MNLNTLSLLITREATDNKALLELLKPFNTRVTVWDSFRLVSLPVFNWSEKLKNNDWLLLTSAKSAQFFFEACPDYDFSHYHLACVGQKTTQTALSYFKDFKEVHEASSLSALANLDLFLESKNFKILFPQTKEGRNDFNERHAFNHSITTVPHYQKEFLSLPNEIKNNIREQKIQIVLFFSPAVVCHFFKELNLNSTQLKDLKFGVIGESTALALDKHGFKPAWQAQNNSVTDLIHQIFSPIKA